jgi:hypothetical protein
VAYCSYGSEVKTGYDVYRIMVGKPFVKLQIRRPRKRWKDSIKMDPKEIGYENWR